MTVETKHVIGHAEPDVVCPHQRAHAEPVVANEEAKADRARNIVVRNIHRPGVEDLNHGAPAGGIVAQHVDHPADFILSAQFRKRGPYAPFNIPSFAYLSSARL